MTQKLSVSCAEKVLELLTFEDGQTIIQKICSNIYGIHLFYGSEYTIYAKCMDDVYRFISKQYIFRLGFEDIYGKLDKRTFSTDDICWVCDTNKCNHKDCIYLTEDEWFTLAKNYPFEDNISEEDMAIEKMKILV
jgi:hypothetical protein